ncbi:conserved hypothetical protein [Verticillium alfalfae VaMs.102]|uniref:D-arabinono-1,4-lactone oxidase n=1 Tax=Verticillium alfalfae (strain VaMs.102 / ATCC MYA-4576 / FGSC 10136) TaxID=526221 RepID=C9SBL4_VERA1|nr:conserved hypothetical protein [Verticillium alfalfae VaMs.102]EEY15748.1 conserved hypothetical protein [Verticillium alfalfae VaMs.102]
MLLQSASLLMLALTASAEPYNTYDGPGFPACHDVAAVYNPKTVDDIQAVVQEAIVAGQKVRASGLGHMWYDTMCSDDPNTVIIRRRGTQHLRSRLEGGPCGRAGVTFIQLASGCTSVAPRSGTRCHWNITLAGSVAMGAHRSSIREDSMVAAGVLEMDIVDGTGQVRRIVRDEKNDDWLAASTSLGLLGVIVRMKFKIYPDFKVYADQKTLDEDKVLNGDIYGMIAPYATANFWWWPYKRKFHWRYYDEVPEGTSEQQGFQNTFSVTALEGNTARVLLDSGKYLATSNMLAEEIFFGQWEKPNFREKTTWAPIEKWPVYGWNYDVLIGGLYPDQRPNWEYGLRAYTLELAFPITQANTVLKRVTYNTSDGADWTKGAIMFDFPSYRPSIGDNLRFNEPFYHKLAKTLVDEFPCRPHWTKNTREVFKNSAKNIDPDHLRRFKVVRKKFDPNGVFKSVVGETLGLY